MSKLDERAANLFGSRPTTTGAGDKVFTNLAWKFRAKGNTTITHFYRPGHKLVDIGWAGKVIPLGDTVIFGCDIESITVSAGGLGEYFLSKSDL